jgi:hypothetical protein
VKPRPCRISPARFSTTSTASSSSRSYMSNVSRVIGDGWRAAQVHVL